MLEFLPNSINISIYKENKVQRIKEKKIKIYFKGIRILKKNAIFLSWAHTCTFATLQLTECAILVFIFCN